MSAFCVYAAASEKYRTKTIDGLVKTLKIQHFAVRNPYANPRDKTGKRGVSSVCGLMSKVLNLEGLNQTIYRFRPVLFACGGIDAKGTHLLTPALTARRFEAGALMEPAGMRCTNEQVGKMRNRLEAEDALRFQC